MLHGVRTYTDKRASRKLHFPAQNHRDACQNKYCHIPHERNYSYIEIEKQRRYNDNDAAQYRFRNEIFPAGRRNYIKQLRGDKLYGKFQPHMNLKKRHYLSPPPEISRQFGQKIFSPRSADGKFASVDIYGIVQIACHEAVIDQKTIIAS